MKLIELPVQETRSGEFKWPSNASQIFQDYDGELRPDADFVDLYLEQVAENHRMCGVPFGELGESYIVTREQYEDALAAAQQPVWNGEGLPPVGCECEASIDGGESWTSWYTMAEDSGVVIFGYLDGDHVAFGKKNMPLFRPIRSEADRLREAAINEIATLIGRGTFYEDAERIYNAITSGEVKLDV